MEYMQTKTRWLVMQLILVFTAQLGARGMHCPDTCSCVMVDIIKDNSALCSFGNSKSNITWTQVNETITLQIECKYAIENSQYDCNDWPQFNISTTEINLVMSGCAPSGMRCVHKMFSLDSHIAMFIVTNLVGSFTANDLADFNHVRTAVFNLQDEYAVTASALINSLSASTIIDITGGNFNPPLGLFNHTKLKTLVFERNNITNLPPDVFIGLPNLDLLTIQSNNFEHLGANSFRGLNLITTLNILNNTLSTIDSGAFSHMKQLTDIYIDNNRLNILPNGLFFGLDKLFKVTIINNQAEMTLDTQAFANLRASIDLLDISNNNVKELPENLFNGTSGISQLSFAKNNIEYLPVNILSTMTNLKQIDLRVNRIRDLADELFIGTKRLERIDLSYNYISTLRENIFTYSPELKEINLSHNRLTQIDWGIFKGTKLKTLSLTFNKLQRMVGKTNLEWQTQLLNLSHNELDVFDDWFVEVGGVENFDLSGNKIPKIKQNQIHRLNKHIKLDLRNNSITELVQNISDPIVNVTSTDISLYLSVNPLQCDCIVTTVLKEWHKYGILADYEAITCDSEGELSNLDVYIQCNKTHALVGLVGSSAIGALVIVVILLSIFTHRKKFWDWINKLFKSNNSKPILINHSINDGVNEIFEMKEEVKLHDLFISFARQDSDIVTNELLPILRNDLDLKVCMNHRNREDDLTTDKQYIESSKIIMIILTEHFLEYERSNSQFLQVHELLKKDEKSRIILVLINKSIIRHKKLPSDLKTYMEMNPYLIWDDIYFSEKLQTILYQNRQDKYKINSSK